LGRDSRDECMVRLPKYSSVPFPYCDEPGGLLAVGVRRCSDEPKAEVCSSLSVSDVRESLSDGEEDSSPNLEGTEDGQGAAGNRAALDMPLESKEAGSGASMTESPLTGESPR